MLIVLGIIVMNSIFKECIPKQLSNINQKLHHQFNQILSVLTLSYTLLSNKFLKD